jgi:PAS domain S-box-containing protein
VNGPKPADSASVVDEAPIALWAAGTDGAFSWVSAEWQRFSGEPTESQLGDGWVALLHPDDRERCTGVYEFARDARETFECEVRLRRADGRFRWMLDRGVPRLEHGRFAGYIGSFTDITDIRSSEQFSRLLADIGAIASDAVDVEQNLQHIARLVVPEFADLCTIALLGGDGRVRRVAISHVDPKEAARLREVDDRVPLRRGDGSALGEVVATGIPLYRPIVDAPGPDEPWPAESHGSARSLIVAPLDGREGVVGACAMVAWDRQFTGDELALVQEVAHRCAGVADTARLYRESEDARARLTLLARIGEELSSALEITDTTHRVLDLVVPAFADVAVIALGDRESYERVDVRHVERDVEERFRAEYVGGGRVVETGSPLSRAIQTRAPVIIETVPIASRRRNGSEGLAPVRQLGARSVIAVPLVGDGRVLGALALGYGPSARRYSAVDVPLVLDIARRVALAIERAQTYVAERQIAETLQRSLLPDELPEVPTMDLCARYMPGGRAEVGGDWYDVVPLPGGRLGLVIGDVAGRGVRAAAVMGQLRNALRAFASEGYEPAAMIERLNRFLFENGPTDMATLCLAAIDATSGHVVAVSAGHPPTLVWRNDGDATWLPGVSGPPVGADQRAHYRALEMDLAPGDALVMYTDGLIERRGESLDRGLERLQDAVQRLRVDESLSEACDELSTALLDDGADDDVAILAVRFVSSVPGTLRWRRPARASELSGMRRLVGGWLDDADVASEDINLVIVAVNEAATNAIEHAYGRHQGWFEVEGRLRGEDLTVVVRDAGQWRPKAAGGGGRGLALIGRLMDEFELRRSDQGTEVWMRRRVRGRGER